MSLVVNEAWKNVVLRHLNQGHALNISASLAKVGIDRITNERQRDTRFDKDVKHAIANAPHIANW